MDLSDAIKEAYEYAPANIIYYDTLEINHASFADAIRVVRSYESLSTNQGTYYPAMFEFSLPETAGAVRGAMKISIAGLPREARAQIRLAAGQRSEITVRYRQYLGGQMEPDAEMPVAMKVVEISETPMGVEATAMLPDLTGMYFPRRLMTLDELPGGRL